MKHEMLTEQLIGDFYALYNDLGHGFLESVYQKGYVLLLAEQGIRYQEQAPICVRYHGHDLGEFRADLVVESIVLVEFKAVSALDLAHEKQTFNYLKATDIEVALLFNFGPRPQFRRLLLDNERKFQRAAAATQP